MSKYSVPDDHWERDDREPVPDRTHTKHHEIEVYYDKEPDPADNYGREKYSVTVSYDDETDEPYVLYAVEHRWKGNYWRDTTNWDWRDLPTAVQEHVAARLPVESPEALDSGTRLVDEGGESRWKTIHKPRMESMSGDEMWGTSYLRDALKGAEGAAEAFAGGSVGEALAEGLVSRIQDAITTVEDSDD